MEFHILIHFFCPPFLHLHHFPGKFVTFLHPHELYKRHGRLISPCICFLLFRIWKDSYILLLQQEKDMSWYKYKAWLCIGGKSTIKLSIIAILWIKMKRTLQLLCKFIKLNLRITENICIAAFRCRTFPFVIKKVFLVW